MAKRMTKRARAHAERAAKVKAVQKVGYTKRAATKFIESLNDYVKTTGTQITPEELMSRAESRKSSAVAQSRMRKTPRGADYAEKMDELDRIMKDLKSRGILAGQIEDMAEAAVEGRYKEALAINKKTIDDGIQQLDELIDDNKQHLQHAIGDEKHEINAEISFLIKERDALVELAARYGTGKPLNIKNTSAAKVLGDLM